MAQSFHSLLAELAHLVPCEPVPVEIEVPQAAVLRLEGIEFTLVRNPSCEDFISVHCKFGRIDGAGGSEDFERLMTANLILAASMAGAFGMTSQTREIVYVFHASLRAMAAPQLLDSMLKIARQAREWLDRQKHATEEEGTVLPSAAAEYA